MQFETSMPRKRKRLYFGAEGKSTIPSQSEITISQGYLQRTGSGTSTGSMLPTSIKTLPQLEI